MLQRLVCLPIKLYQYFISPLNKPCCRFYPSCSEYAINAIQYYGINKGLWMAFKRILRCQPWSKHSGYDPIPPKK